MGAVSLELQFRIASNRGFQHAPLTPGQPWRRRQVAQHLGTAQGARAIRADRGNSTPLDQGEPITRSPVEKPGAKFVAKWPDRLRFAQAQSSMTSPKFARCPVRPRSKHRVPVLWPSHAHQARASTAEAYSPGARAHTRTLMRVLCRPASAGSGIPLPRPETSGRRAHITARSPRACPNRPRSALARRQRVAPCWLAHRHPRFYSAGRVTFTTLTVADMHA